MTTNEHNRNNQSQAIQTITQRMENNELQLMQLIRSTKALDKKYYLQRVQNKQATNYNCVHLVRVRQKGLLTRRLKSIFQFWSVFGNTFGYSWAPDRQHGLRLDKWCINQPKLNRETDSKAVS